MRNILKSLIVLSGVVSSCYSPFLHATILDNPENVREMLGSGVPVAAISAARKEQTQETVTNLILGAASCYPLEAILALYPGHEGAASASDGVRAGDAAFFDACAQSPELYSKVFHAFTAPYFYGGEYHYNPLTESRFECQITDKTTAVYTPLSLARTEAQRVYHTLFHTLFINYKGEIEHAPNLVYLKRLLNIRFSILKPSVAKRKPEQANLIKKINLMAPFLLGEIAEAENDLNSAWLYFSEASKSGYKSDTYDLLMLHMAEIQLGVHTDTIVYCPELLDAKEGVRILLGLGGKNPYALLRLSQYYLGFFGHKIEERKGLRTIAKAVEYGQVSHLAYRVWAEYYLGVTDPDKFDMPRATELLEQAFRASEGIESLEAQIHLRKGEIALGIFGELGEATQGGDEGGLADFQSEVNVPLAAALFEQVKPDADMFLHRIYTGYFGDEYENPEAAQAVIARLEARGSKYIQAKQAMEAYKRGNVARAVELFESLGSTTFGDYFLGRIKSNPQYQGLYNPMEAIAHFRNIYESNFRDSRARLCKLILRGSGMTVSRENVNMAVEWFFSQIQSGRDFTLDGLREHGFEIRDETKLFPSAGDPTSVLEEELGAVPSGEGPSDADGQGEFQSPTVEQDEVQALVDLIETIDETVPIQVLSDPKLQALYDNLGSTVRWRHFKRVVEAFGGKIDMARQTIIMPHSEKPFNFHRLHSGNPMLSLCGYWAHLKRMIDHEYEVLCQMEDEMV